MCHSTPTSLHVSVLHPELSCLLGGPSPASPETFSPEEKPSFDPGTVTPCKLSGDSAVSLAIATPSPLPYAPKPLVYDSPAHSPASSVFPWQPNPSAPAHPVPLFDGITEGCGCAASCHDSMATSGGPGIDGYSPGGGARMSVEQTPPPFTQPPPFAEGGTRQHCGGDTESGAVQSAVAPAAVPMNVGLAKDTCADAPASRSMIGSERPLSRPATGGSAAPDLTAGGSVTCAGVATAGSGVADALAAASVGLGSGGGCPPGDTAGPVNVLQLDCTVSRDSIAGGSPCEACMSPVATPAGLNSIRLPRPRAGAPADPAAERDTATSADMWAGASPFLSVLGDNTPAFAPQQPPPGEDIALTVPVCDKAAGTRIVAAAIASETPTRGSLRPHGICMG